MAKTPKVSKIESFNSANMKALLAECEAALREIAQRHGLTLTRKNCRWRNNEFALPFQMIVSEGVVEGADARATLLSGDYLRHCERFGLQKHWIGKSIEHPNHGTLTIVGLAPKSTHYPVVVETQRGARYKLPACDVRELMQPNEDAKVAPGTKVIFKHEDEVKGVAVGPAWIDDGKTKRRIEHTLDSFRVVEDLPQETSADPDGRRPFGRPYDGRRIGWVQQPMVKRYAASIGATFVEG